MKFKITVCCAFLTMLMIVTLSCQVSTESVRSRTWPGSYPEPIGLKGLKTVSLEVSVIGPIPSSRIEADSLEDTIKREAVQSLNSAGITITENTRSESDLRLHMLLSCETDSSSCGHYTSLELRRWVRLERNPDVMMAAIIWRNSYMNGMNRKDLDCCLPSQLAVDAGSLIAGFVQGIRTANPRSTNNLTPQP